MHVCVCVNTYGYIIVLTFKLLKLHRNHIMDVTETEFFLATSQLRAVESYVISFFQGKWVIFPLQIFPGLFQGSY